MAALKESFAICDAAFAALTDSRARETVTMGQSGFQLSKLSLLVSMISHSNEQHGYMAMYLRLKGIVPPSTEAMSTGTLKAEIHSRVIGCVCAMLRRNPPIERAMSGAVHLTGGSRRMATRPEVLLFDLGGVLARVFRRSRRCASVARRGIRIRSPRGVAPMSAYGGVLPWQVESPGVR